MGVDISEAMVQRFNESVSNQGIEPSEMVAIQKDVLIDDPAELGGELFDVVIASRSLQPSWTSLLITHTPDSAHKHIIT